MKTMRKRTRRSQVTRRSRVTSKRSRSRATKRTKRSAVKGGTSSYRRALNQAKDNVIKVDIDCENKSQAEIGEEMLALQLQLKKRFVLNRKEKKRKLKLLEQCYSEKSMNVPRQIEIIKPKPHYAINSSGRSNISGVSGSFSPESEKIDYALFEKDVNVKLGTAARAKLEKQIKSSQKKGIQKVYPEIEKKSFNNSADLNLQKKYHMIPGHGSYIASDEKAMNRYSAWDEHLRKQGKYNTPEYIENENLYASLPGKN